MIKLLIFDIGGVITHTNFKKLYSNFASRIGISSEFVINYHKENVKALILGKITLDKFWQDMRDAGGNPDLNYSEIWIEEWFKIKNVDEELLKTITQLRNNYKVCALTNLTESRSLIDEKLGLYSYFDFVVLSFKEHIEKPDPKFYQLALDRGSVKAEEAVFIDDKDNLTAAAEGLGMKTVLFTNNEAMIRDLNKLGVKI